MFEDRASRKLAVVRMFRLHLVYRATFSTNSGSNLAIFSPSFVSDRLVESRELRKSGDDKRDVATALIRVILSLRVSTRGGGGDCTVASNSGGKNLGTTGLTGRSAEKLYSGAPSVLSVIGLTIFIGLSVPTVPLSCAFEDVVTVLSFKLALDLSNKLLPLNALLPRFKFPRGLPAA